MTIIAFTISHVIHLSICPSGINISGSFWKLAWHFPSVFGSSQYSQQNPAMLAQVLRTLVCLCSIAYIPKDCVFIFSFIMTIWYLIAALCQFLLRGLYFIMTLYSITSRWCWFIMDIQIFWGFYTYLLNISRITSHVIYVYV